MALFHATDTVVVNRANGRSIFLRVTNDQTIARATIITNADAAEETEHRDGPFHGFYKILTPNMRDRGGKLGLNISRVLPGETSCPFHAHQLEDEVFYVISGTGILRYGDATFAIGSGDCIECPAGTGIAHQLANNGSVDLVYLSAGNNEPNEVCVYPDSEKVMVRSLQTVGVLAKTPYAEREPNPPKVAAMDPEH